MRAKIAGMVLRTRSREASGKFYEALGLILNEHAHGGPTHFEMGPNAHDLVFEMYKGSVNFSEDTLMIEVDSLDEALRICEEFKVLPYEDLRKGEGIRFAYVLDLDNRSVMLLEKTSRSAS
jgi:hypothetical protein